MRSRLTTFGMLLTLGVALGGLPAEGRAAQAMLSCPGMAQAGQPLTVEVTIAVGTTPLGAYSIVVGHDPAVLTLASVAGGTTTEFSGRPTTNTPMPGTANLAAYQSASLTSPTGVVSVARITFNVTASTSTTTDIALTVKDLYDTNSMPILPTTGTGCSVSLSGTAPTTTTASATSTTTTTQPPTTTTTQPTTTTTFPRSSTTTTPATTSSTTTASTASLPGRTTTTTTPPCTSARCTLEAVQTNAACAGQTIPASVANKFSRAANLIDQAATSSAKRARSLLKKAKRTLKQAGAKAIRATKGKTPKLSSDCGAALKDAANGVLAGLGV